MRLSDFLHSFTRKLLLLLLALCLLAIAGYFIWEKSKFFLIKNKIANIFLAKTDSLYSIHYDSLFFDEQKGDIFLKNIHIIPDTQRVQKGLRNNPYLVLDITMSSLSIKGIKTNQALKGEQIIGDSIIITEPNITAYILRKVRRETKIDVEAKNIYREIFHKLKLIQVAEVRVNEAQIHAVNFFNHERQFQLENVNLHLHDVRIDSLHNEDTSRILFCKEASFGVGRFSAFNKDREQLSIEDIRYTGGGRRLTFSKLLLNRFDDEKATGVPMVVGNNMIITGINNFEVVRNKNITIDSIYCHNIKFYLPPSPSFKPGPLVNGKLLSKDTAGFRAAYSLDLKTASVVLKPRTSTCS